jgi:hypothetical protein
LSVLQNPLRLSAHCCPSGTRLHALQHTAGWVSRVLASRKGLHVRCDVGIEWNMPEFLMVAPARDSVHFPIQADLLHLYANAVIERWNASCTQVDWQEALRWMLMHSWSSPMGVALPADMPTGTAKHCPDLFSSTVPPACSSNARDRGASCTGMSKDSSNVPDALLASSVRMPPERASLSLAMELFAPSGMYHLPVEDL